MTPEFDARAHFQQQIDSENARDFHELMAERFGGECCAWIRVIQQEQWTPLVEHYAVQKARLAAHFAQEEIEVRAMSRALSGFVC